MNEEIINALDHYTEKMGSDYTNLECTCEMCNVVADFLQKCKILGISIFHDNLELFIE